MYSVVTAGGQAYSLCVYASRRGHAVSSIRLWVLVVLGSQVAPNGRTVVDDGLQRMCKGAVLSFFKISASSCFEWVRITAKIHFGQPISRQRFKLRTSLIKKQFYFTVNFVRYIGKMPFHEEQLRILMEAIVDCPSVLFYMHLQRINEGGGKSCNNQ